MYGLPLLLNELVKLIEFGIVNEYCPFTFASDTLTVPRVCKYWPFSEKIKTP
ncbi:hypothetical protein D3C73_867200 [compost metagenome]